MKKTYIAPFCKIREVKRCDIIATSETDTMGTTNNKTGWSGNVGGFGRDGWWDDDDDE